MIFMKKENFQSFFGLFLSLFFFSYFFYKSTDYILNYINKNAFTQVNNVIVNRTDINITNFETINCLYDDDDLINSKLKFSDLLESIEIIDGDEFEIAKYFRKHGSKIVEYSSEGTLTLENKKGKFSIEEINVKKHQS